MGLNLNNCSSGGGGAKQELLEVGTYPARLVQVIDLGIQAQRPYQGQEKPPAHMVSFTYELLDVFMLDEEGNDIEDKPRWISEQFPIYHPSADLAKSTKRVKALDPDNDFDFDLSKLVGQPCMVTTAHKESKGKTYCNISNVTTMRARDVAKAPQLVNDPVVFSLDEPDMAVFKKLPEWLQTKIKENLEYNGSNLQEALGEKVEESASTGEEW